MRLPQLQLLALLLITSATLFAQSYRGVQVGQRGDLLPPQFSEVKRGEYRAEFGAERMDVYVNGALVTGFKVTPLVPITLAEAIAKHGSIPNISKMLTILDYYGESQGMADPIFKISYITSAISPDSVITSVGYYDTNASMLLWLGDASPGFLQVLDITARSVSLQDLNNRPRVTSPDAAAKYLVGQAAKAARIQGEDAWVLVKAYAQSCSNTPACLNERKTMLEEIRKAGDKFHAGLVRAEETYVANADLLGNIRPPELDRLQQMWKELVPKVREFMAQSSR